MGSRSGSTHLKITTDGGQGQDRPTSRSQPMGSRSGVSPKTDTGTGAVSRPPAEPGVRTVAPVFRRGNGDPLPSREPARAGEREPSARFLSPAEAGSNVGGPCFPRLKAGATALTPASPAEGPHVQSVSIEESPQEEDHDHDGDPQQEHENRPGEGLAEDAAAATTPSGQVPTPPFRRRAGEINAWRSAHRFPIARVSSALRPRLPSALRPARSYAAVPPARGHYTSSPQGRLPRTITDQRR